MWQCPKCGWTVQDSSRMSHHCGTIRDAATDAGTDRAAEQGPQPIAEESADQAAPVEVERPWVCPGCGERVPGNFEICWKCQADREASTPPDPAAEPVLAVRVEPQEEAAAQAKTDRPQPTLRRQVAFQCFRDAWGTWHALFQEAADFATRIGPERLISISHSEDDNDGIVTVWYWEDG